MNKFSEPETRTDHGLKGITMCPWELWLQSRTLIQGLIRDGGARTPEPERESPELGSEFVPGALWTRCHVASPRIAFTTRQERGTPRRGGQCQ